MLPTCHELLFLLQQSTVLRTSGAAETEMTNDPLRYQPQVPKLRFEVVAKQALFLLLSSGPTLFCLLLDRSCAYSMSSDNEVKDPIDLEDEQERVEQQLEDDSDNGESRPNPRKRALSEGGSNFEDVKRRLRSLSHDDDGDENDNDDDKEKAAKDDDNADEQDLQRSKEELLKSVNETSTPATATVPTNEGEVTEILRVAPKQVGIIIGAKGIVIQEIQLRSGCKIHINQDFPPDVPREAIMTGTRKQIDEAKAMIDNVLVNGPTSILLASSAAAGINNATMQEIECPQQLVGRVIGGMGSMIREIQSRTGVRIQVKQDMPEGVPRRVQITGTPEAINAASTLVRHVMDNPPGTPLPLHAVYTPPPAPTTIITSGSHTMDIAKPMVGRIIGRAGETINMIQSRSGAKVQIMQDVPEGAPCKLTITGTPQGATMALQMVQELIATGMLRAHMYPPINAPPAAAVYYPPPQQQQPAHHAQPVTQHAQVPQYTYSPYQATYYPPTSAPATSAAPYAPAPTYSSSQYAAPQQHYAPPHQQPYPAQHQYAAPQQHSYSAPQQQQQRAPVATYAPPHAAAAPKPAVNSPWSEHKTEDGIPYWYNSTTGVSQVIVDS